MTNEDQDKQNANLAKLIKNAKDTFSPVLTKELYTHLAKEYKLIYDCFRKEGFDMKEALRLTVKYYD